MRVFGIVLGVVAAVLVFLVALPVWLVISTVAIWKILRAGRVAGGEPLPGRSDFDTAA